MNLIRESIFSIVGCFCFGMLFNIKGKKLLFASLGGGLSWFVYSLCLNNNISEISSLLISSIIFSIYSEIMARILKTPVTSLIICALLPLVPGAGMYYTMYDVVTGNISSSISTGLNTLALGVILVTTITRIITKKRLQQ